MANTKITALTALTGANLATGDHLVLVDVSDTSMAATGTTKRITGDELAIGIGTTLGIVGRDKIFDAKGDLAVGTGADTAQKLTVGTNGLAVVADSAQTTGLKYGTLATVASVTSDHNTSLQTLGDVAGLASFATVAGATYWFRFDLMVQSNATTVGILCSVNHSTAVTSIRYLQEYPTSATAWTMEQVTALQGGTLPTAGPGATNTRYTIVGQVVINTAGTLALQSRSETATQTTVKAGSVGLVQRVA